MTGRDDTHEDLLADGSARGGEGDDMDLLSADAQDEDEDGVDDAEDEDSGRPSP